MFTVVTSRRLALSVSLVLAALAALASVADAQGNAIAGRATAAPATGAARDTLLGKSAHKKLVCVACHTSLDPKNLATARTVAPVDCLHCHQDAQFKHDFHPELAQSIRANRAPKVACKDCHGTHDVSAIDDPQAKFGPSRVVESCGKCHQKPADAFPASAHGKALTASAQGAPTCLSCHRTRITAKSGPADSLALKTAQAKLCLTCHLDTPEVRARTSKDAGFVAQWTTNSKHGAALEHGKAGAANCVSCHGSHDIRKVTDAAATVSHTKVVGTCALCHTKEKDQFAGSAHGLAKDHAKSDSLVCSTCHGEHGDPFPPSLRPKGTTDSLPAQICQRCHFPAVLAGKYGLSNERFQSFSDSYHGLTMHNGKLEAANCASCHTAHDVKPAKDATSSVSRANRVAVCGKCHMRAIERFSKGPVHDTSAAARRSATRKSN